MKNEVLLRAIGNIDDKLIADAERETRGEKKHSRRKLGLIAACLTLVFCTGIMTNVIRSQAEAGTFTMDVNPSVAYTIAKNGLVKDVRFLNDDAENALRDVVLKKQSVQTALTRTMTAYEACGYLADDETTVLISFDSQLNADTERKAVLSAEIQEALEPIEAVGTLIFHAPSEDQSDAAKNAEIAKLAEKFHVSSGKADWILNAADKTGLPTEDVARMPLDELLKLQQAESVASYTSEGDTLEANEAEGSTLQTDPAKFISLEEAKKIALKDAKLNEAAQKIVFTREELSRNQGKPCYFLEFYTGTNSYFYQIDAKTGRILFANKYILLSTAKKIAIDDAGCKNRVTFTEETLVDGGIKSPYYRLVFADTQIQWTYRIDAVLGIVIEKKQKEIAASEPDPAKFISLEDARKIALTDAALHDAAQKIVFTREELSRNQGKPCYFLEFYTGTNSYFYQIDAKSGEIIYAREYILLSTAKKIAIDDAGCKNRVTFTEETLVDGGIKSPYYRLVFADTQIQWTYRIDAVLGIVIEKKQKEIAASEPDPAKFISLEDARKIALTDAALHDAAQKIVFTREVLSRNQGKPCYILEFHTDKCAYSYKIDAVSGDIIEKNTAWLSRQESERTSSASQDSDSKQRRAI